MLPVPRVAGWCSIFHSIKVLFCPAAVEWLSSSSPLRAGFIFLPSGCAAPRRLLAPARCAPRLPRPRPSSASRFGAPRCPQETASSTPRPGPRAGSPRPRETWPLAPARRIDYPLPQSAETKRCGHIPGLARRLKQAPGERDGGGDIRPAGHRSDGAGACGHRAGGPRWGIAGAVSGEQRGALPRDVPARSHAQAGRRAGLDAQPERPLRARGAKKNQPRSEKRAGRAPARQNMPHAVKKR